jgi:hypothetical protein
MKKLTSAQVENLSIALAHQFNGKVIALSKSSYNENEVEVGKNKYITERQNVAFCREQPIGNRTFGKVLRNTECLQYLDLGYNRFQSTFMINVAKVLEYSNGQEVVQKALTYLQNNIVEAEKRTTEFYAQFLNQ